MWGTAPEADVVEDWIGRALELASPESAARAKALIARCYSDYDKSLELAEEANEIAERLGDPVIRSYGYDVHGLRAFAAGDYEEAVDWHRRRLSLVGEIGDPDHQADIYGNAIAPAVSRGEFDEARRYTASNEDVTRGLSPHHRLHGVSASLELEEPRQLGRRQPAAAAGGRRRGRKRRDAVRAKSALSARVRSLARTSATTRPADSNARRRPTA